METLRAKKGFICDMDGVIYRGREIIPGAKEFVKWLVREDKKFLFLTNASTRTPAMIQKKLARMGLDVDTSHLYTASLATAKFLSRQHPGCSALSAKPG
jgi:NagD protein